MLNEPANQDIKIKDIKVLVGSTERDATSDLELFRITWTIRGSPAKKGKDAQKHDETKTFTVQDLFDNPETPFLPVPDPKDLYTVPVWPFACDFVTNFVKNGSL